MPNLEAIRAFNDAAAACYCYSVTIHTQPGPNPHGLGLAWKRGSVELGERFIGSIYSSGTA